MYYMYHLYGYVVYFEWYFKVNIFGIIIIGNNDLLWFDRIFSLNVVKVIRFVGFLRRNMKICL